MPPGWVGAHLRAGTLGAVQDRCVVRTALPEDLEGLLDLYDELGEGRPGTAPLRGPGAAGLLASVLAQPGRTLLVAALGGRLAGTADLLVVPNLTHEGRPWAVVESVVVAAWARRRGVGRCLFDEVFLRCRAAGCYKVGLSSSGHRDAAHAFYASLGFESTAVAFRHYFE